MSFDATFPAELRAIGEVRLAMTRLAEDCGLGPAAVDDVALAVSEIATNAIVHGYRGGHGVIHVRADRTGTQLRIAIADEGGGMAPRLDSPGLGLGMAIVGKVADRVDVASDGPGTTVEILFPCPAA